VQFGISVLDLPRAKILPGLDFQPQRLTKLAWKGLREHRGGDALAFIEGWDLRQEDYQELGRLFDLLGDAQAAACAWVKGNRKKWESLVKFPERKSAPFFCAATQDRKTIGLCSERSYILGWIVFFLQIILCIMITILSGHLWKPKPFADGRAALDQALPTGEKANINKEESLLDKSGSFHFKKSVFSPVSDKFVKNAGNYGTRVEFTRQVARATHTHSQNTHRHTKHTHTRTRTQATVLGPEVAHTRHTRTNTQTHKHTNTHTHTHTHTHKHTQATILGTKVTQAQANL